ncbi:MAG TPA: DUF362 domain-containing protein [Candidatus Dormibacteraeota bacterium]|nr:DUF362 domain-containing protein [Candidatus Dormibacteraeota bacterium]
MAISTHPLIPPSNRPPSRVAIRKATDYDGKLVEIIHESLREFQLPVAGKSVLLKPNLVQADPGHVINTHPAVIAAARESFLRLGASRVMVGEGPGLERDVEGILETIRMRDWMGRLDDQFVDLNLDEVRAVDLRTRASKLRRLFLPVSVLEADMVVSIPKLKTHHWAGVTLSMKNLFGIVPGSCYGWPKNLLHWAGIGNSILDLATTVRPDFSIIDGIIAMEGNGPTQGTPKAAGVLVMGDDPVAVDATATRLMGLAPERIGYLQKAGYVLGNLRAEKIVQIGESLEETRTPFVVLEQFCRLVEHSARVNH